MRARGDRQVLEAQLNRLMVHIAARVIAVCGSAGLAFGVCYLGLAAAPALARDTLSIASLFCSAPLVNSLPAKVTVWP